jgi:hypothetical protein
MLFLPTMLLLDVCDCLALTPPKVYNDSWAHLFDLRCDDRHTSRTERAAQKREPVMNQDCACLCGAAGFTVAGAPIGRFLCHCTICQKAYGKPFADVTYFAARSVTLPPNPPIDFRRHRAPPALRRGKCTKCGNPVVNLLGRVPIALAFVPSQNFPRPAELPAPERHIFYDRRVADVADTLPKVSGYWASQAHVTRSILGSLFGAKRAA